MDKQTVQEGRAYAFIAYLTLFGTLIAFFMNRDRRNDFTSFHIRQALGLGLSYLVIGYMISQFNSLSFSIVFWIVFFGLYVFGIVSALTGKATPIPLVGAYFQKIFKSVGQ
jgi:uncharacterized membrane protein